MPSDRGTMQRGLTSGTADQAAWPQPTVPASRRLPSAPRERKPVLAALAVLLIAGGALSAAFLVIQSGKRVAAVEITQQVAAGQRIPLSAMQEVQIASQSGLAYVPWSQASQVAQYYAATTIPAGTLLTSAMVAQGSNVTAGKEVVGLALKEGEWPVSLRVGDRLTLYAVSGQTSSSAGCPGTGGTSLAAGAVVLAISGQASGTLVGGTTQGGTTDVTVAVSPGNAGAVACNAAAGNVAVAVMPAFGTQAASGAGARSAAGTGAAGNRAGRPGRRRALPRQASSPSPTAAATAGAG